MVNSDIYVEGMSTGQRTEQVVAVQKHIVVQGCTSSMVRTIDAPYLMYVYSRGIISTESVGVLEGKEVGNDRLP